MEKENEFRKSILKLVKNLGWKEYKRILLLAVSQEGKFYFTSKNGMVKI